MSNIYANGCNHFYFPNIYYPLMYDTWINPLTSTNTLTSLLTWVYEYVTHDWLIMWLVTRSEMKWWNTTFVFECCMFGFSLITLQLFISWQWKQNHGYWSLNVFFCMYWWLNVMNWWYCVYVFVNSFLVFFFWIGHLLFQEISLSWKDESIRF